MSAQKFKSVKNSQLEKLKLAVKQCYQTDIKGQKLVKNAKIEWLKWDFFGHFQTICTVGSIFRSFVKSNNGKSSSQAHIHKKLISYLIISQLEQMLLCFFKWALFKRIWIMTAWQVLCCHQGNVSWLLWTATGTLKIREANWEKTTSFPC